MTRGGATSALATFVSTFGIMFVNVVSGFLVARILNVEDRGVLAAIFVWSSIVIHVGEMGGPAAFAFLSAQHPELTEPLNRSALFIAAAQSVLLCVVGTLVIWFAIGRIGGPILISIAFIWLTVPTKLYARYLTALFQGTKSFVRFSVSRSSLQLAYAAGVLALFAFGIHQLTWVVFAMVLANAVWCVVAWTLFESKHRPRSADLPSVVRRVFSYGIPAHLGNLAPLDFLQLDLAFVAATLGAREAGLYAVAASAASVVRSMGMSIGILALPLVASSKSEKARSDAITTLFRFNLAITLGSCLTMLALARLLIQFVYGNEYAEAVPIYRVLVLAMGVAATRQVLGDALRGAGQPMKSTVAELACLMTFIAAVYPLSLTLGVEGVALASAIAYVVALLFMVYSSVQRDIPLNYFFLPHKQDAERIRLVLRSASGTLRGRRLPS